MNRSRSNPARRKQQDINIDEWAKVKYSEEYEAGET
jgi:hypothetical protein